MPIPASSGTEARRFSQQRSRARRRRVSPATPTRPVVSAPQRRHIGPENRPHVRVRRRVLPKQFKTERAAEPRLTPTKRRAVQRGTLRAAANAEFQRRERRRRYFSDDPVSSLREKTKEGVKALSELQSSDPEAYKRRGRSGLENVVRKVADATDQNLKGAGEHIKRLTSNEGPSQSRLKSAGIADPGKIGREAVDIVTNTPSGVYLAGAAGYEAAKGDTSRGKELIKDFKDTSAWYPAIKGDWKEAAKRAAARPLTTALEGSGGKAVFGRGAGAAMRKAPSKRIRQAASIQRPNLKLYDPKREGPGPEEQRFYSRDVINKSAQVAVERQIRKGSRVRRHGSKAGTQRRPGRDPNVDRGMALVPARPVRGGGQAPVRRHRLDRRVDTRYFSQQRVLEQERRKVTAEAKRAFKTPEGREALALAARADKIRAALREEAKHSSPAARKDIRETLALTDERLLDLVEASGKPHMSKRGTYVRPFTPEEQVVAARAIERRARKGKSLTPALRTAVEGAVGHHVARDVRARSRPPELPNAGVARGIAAASAGQAPRWRISSPREQNLANRLTAEDFSGFFAGQTRPASVPGRRLKPTPLQKKLAGIEVAPGELVPSSVSRALHRLNVQNQRLLADEFGIPVTKKKKYARSRDRVQIWIDRNRPDSDLVPFQRGEGQWVAAPRAVAQRLQAHRNVDESVFGPGSKLDRATSLFKDVVLTTASPSKWLGGNIGDIGMRTAMAGITPFDIARGRGITTREQATGLQGRQSAAATTGGGLYTAAEAVNPQIGAVSRANVPRKAWRTWKGTVFALEHAIEVLPQYGAKGKDMRRQTRRMMPQADMGMKNSLRGLLKLHDEQMTAYAHELATNRAMEARVAKATEDVIGRWGKVSPTMRRSLSLAPFAQWLGAATRYVYVTLPVHHPIKTGILAGISSMTEDERMRLGLSYFAPNEQRASDYQMGMLPMWVGKNKYGPVVEGIRTSRMTSLGTAGSAPWNLPEFLMPQISSGLNALRGQSFTGEPLEYPPYAGAGKEGLPMDMMDRLPVAIGAQAESMIPFAGAFRRSILEQGRPSEPYSTILTPATRPQFDYDSREYTEREGSPLQGLKEWGMPFAPRSRIYTLGAQRDIERSQNTLRQLEQWNARRKKRNAGKDIYGPKDDDFWDGKPPPPPKPAVKPKSPVDDFWSP